MRVKWLEVHCADGLQVSFSSSDACLKVFCISLPCDIGSIEFLVHKDVMQLLLHLLSYDEICFCGMHCCLDLLLPGTVVTHEVLYGLSLENKTHQQTS